MAVAIGTLAEEAFYNFGFMALDAGERALLGPLQGLGGLVTGFAKNKALEFADCFLKDSSSSQNQPKGDLTNTAKEMGFFALQSLYFMGTGALTSFGTQFLFRNKAFATLAGRAFKNYAPLLVPQLAHLLTNPVWQLGLQFLTGQPLHLPTWEQLAMSTVSALGGMALGVHSKNPRWDHPSTYPGQILRGKQCKKIQKKVVYNPEDIFDGLKGTEWRKQLGKGHWRIILHDWREGLAQLTVEQGHLPQSKKGTYILLDVKAHDQISVIDHSDDNLRIGRRLAGCFQPEDPLCNIEDYLKRSFYNRPTHTTALQAIRQLPALALDQNINGRVYVTITGSRHVLSSFSMTRKPKETSASHALTLELDLNPDGVHLVKMGGDHEHYYGPVLASLHLSGKNLTLGDDYLSPEKLPQIQADTIRAYYLDGIERIKNASHIPLAELTDNLRKRPLSPLVRSICPDRQSTWAFEIKASWGEGYVTTFRITKGALDEKITRTGSSGVFLEIQIDNQDIKITKAHRLHAREVCGALRTADPSITGPDEILGRTKKTRQQPDSSSMSHSAPKRHSTEPAVPIPALAPKQSTPLGVTDAITQVAEPAPLSAQHVQLPSDTSEPRTSPPVTSKEVKEGPRSLKATEAPKSEKPEQPQVGAAASSQEGSKAQKPSKSTVPPTEPVASPTAPVLEPKPLAPVRVTDLATHTVEPTHVQSKPAPTGSQATQRDKRGSQSAQPALMAAGKKTSAKKKTSHKKNKKGAANKTANAKEPTQPKATNKPFVPPTVKPEPPPIANPLPPRLTPTGPSVLITDDDKSINYARANTTHLGRFLTNPAGPPFYEGVKIVTIGDITYAVPLMEGNNAQISQAFETGLANGAFLDGRSHLECWTYQGVWTQVLEHPATRDCFRSQATDLLSLGHQSIALTPGPNGLQRLGTQTIGLNSETGVSLRPNPRANQYLINNGLGFENYDPAQPPPYPHVVIERFEGNLALSLNQPPDTSSRDMTDLLVKFGWVINPKRPDPERSTAILGRPSKDK